MSYTKTGEKHHQWKGDSAGFGAIHRWVRRHKPQPQLCDNCQINTPFDVANISGRYLRDINDYQWLCRSCHMTQDGRINNLKKGLNANVKRNKKGQFEKVKK
jgi:hypothetical protein